MKRMLQTHHSFWNLTKNGSDVKIQHTQSKKPTISNNNVGAKYFDRMLMIVFSEAHRGSVMHAEGYDDKLNSCKFLEKFRMRAKQKK